WYPYGMAHAPDDLPRLQKALAAAGVASRRACEALIASGKVSVNGRVVTESGTKVDPQRDDIRVEGVPIGTAATPKPVYIMLHKPRGVVSTVRDPHAQKTVLDLVSQVETRVYPVGRLDADSAGLLLLTNDGEFANRLTHPRYHVPRVYRVRARGFLDREAARRLQEGIELPDGMTAPAGLSFVEYDPATQCTIVDITLYEGRNRQVRRMMEAVGHPVRELTRIAFGNLRLGMLAPGTWRKLRPEEVAGLLQLAQPTPTPKREARRPKPSGPYRPRNPASRPPAQGSSE
ncbi:MAG TPA: pseudouridine synthase, partial [Chthonomonadaceae bacterium]|nr:pseudouridine synthase [Chthonomonadaceae bacterium]